MPERQRKQRNSSSRNTSGRSPRRARNRQPHGRKDQPYYGWQNIYGYDSDDGNITGNISVSTEWVLSLAMRIINEEYDRMDEDPLLRYDVNDDDRIVLQFKMRPADGKCHWLGNIYESDPDTGRESRQSSRTRVTREQDEEEPQRKRGRQTRRDVPRNTSRRARYIPVNEDEDDYDENYDDNPF